VRSKLQTGRSSKWAKRLIFPYWNPFYCSTHKSPKWMESVILVKQTLLYSMVETKVKFVKARSHSEIQTLRAADVDGTIRDVSHIRPVLVGVRPSHSDIVTSSWRHGKPTVPAQFISVGTVRVIGTVLGRHLQSCLIVLYNIILWLNSAT